MSKPSKKNGPSHHTLQQALIPDFLQLLDAAEVDDPALASVLTTTYNTAAQVYTWAGTQCLIGISPLRVPSLVADLQSSETKNAWYKQYKNVKCEPWTPPQQKVQQQTQSSASQAYRKDSTNHTTNASSSSTPSLPPHAFALANNVYFLLRRTATDQCIVLSGEAGSSKSFQAHLLMQQLCSISGNTKKDEKVHERVLAVSTILNALGSACTTHSVDSTKVGLYYEVLFSEKGKMVGMRTVPYVLERDRVLAQKQGERNFHAFYYLLAGADLELRQELGLMPNAHYPYLNHGTSPINTIDDAGRFQHWQQAMLTLGLSKRHQFYIFKLLAAILHLGHIQFTEDTKNNSSYAIVKNTDALAFVANLLEVDMDVMEATLTSTIRYSEQNRELITELLTPARAQENRDQLAKLLYHALFMWMVEYMNKKLVNVDEAANFIGIVDFPGRVTSSSSTEDYLSASNPTALQWAYCNERIEHLVLKRLFNHGNAQLREQGFNIADAGYAVSEDANSLLFQLPKESNAFPGNFVQLFRGGHGQGGSRAPMYQALFGQTVLDMQAFDSNAVALIKPPVLRPKPLLAAADTKSTYNKFMEAEVLVEQMEALVEALSNTSIKTLFCLRPNLDRNSTSLDQTYVARQLRQLQVSTLVRYLTKRNGSNYNFRMDPVNFLTKYASLFDLSTVSTTDPRVICSHIRSLQNMSELDFYIGPSLIILRDEAFVHFEHLLKLQELDKLPPEFLGQDKTDAGSIFSETTDMSDLQSNFGHDMTMDGSVPSLRQASLNKHIDNVPQEPVEEEKTTFLRKCWVMMTWSLTWWIPSFALSQCGGLKRDDVRMAWREKVAIFILILLCCALQLFFIIGLGQLVCPRQNVLNLAELYYKSSDARPLVGIYGGVYDLNSFFSRPYHSLDLMRSFIGYDITAGFPRTPAYYCEYAKKNKPDFPAFFNNVTTIANGTYIQTRHRSFYSRDLNGAQRLVDYSLKINVKKLVGWDPNDVRSLSTSSSSGRLRKMFIINERVYDIQPYIDSLGEVKQDFFPAGLIDYLNSKPGIDLTQEAFFMKAWRSDPALRICFENLFNVGVVDYRKSSRCLFSNYILVAFSAFLAMIIAFKFLAALQLSSPGTPEEHDKFVILQVPCYTENEESLRRTIDSLATLEYDDKRKLLFLICDGNIMGSGNDRPTPRIVLDILGIPSDVDPQPLVFQSIGEGSKQYNMGKVYSGLYGVQGHLVPYLVVVKVGMPNEVVKPGNRGKRDSQMVLMRFLNKVCFDSAMSPLELEMYHHIKNIIGVNPSFYEYCLMVDADTVVHPDALIRLVSVMMHDTKVMGVCGETKLCNEKDTWATMIQVYEYFISHHMAKAFESLFGSVTCLPGCFCMYRLRSPNRNSPLLVSNALVKEYGDCNVDTLHKKNLLSLGEDRYLTTLMLKHFPNMRTVFTADAKCETIAPERWSVLLSQRRRWINSTVHNLIELLNISELCGFCCFSMRFVVFIDLIATLVQPAVVVYLGYLIYLIIASTLDMDNNDFPMISLILLAVIYGFQAIIFLLKREWQHIGWMIIYLFAIPVFSFFIPLYSFWHMDDFTWGNTRRVVGDNGKRKLFGSDESEKFDLRKIPHKKWAEYEAEKAKAASNPSSSSSSANSNGGHVDDAKSVSGRSVRSRRAVPAPSPSQQQQQQQEPFTERGSSLKNLGANDAAFPRALPTSSFPSPSTTFSRFPSDMELFKQIESTLATADLMRTTKKQIRDQLSAHFRVDLTPKKDFINRCINEILSSKM